MYTSMRAMQTRRLKKPYLVGDGVWVSFDQTLAHGVIAEINSLSQTPYRVKLDSGEAMDLKPEDLKK